MQEMALAWEEYSRLERSVEQLRMALQAHMNHSATPQVTPGTAAVITFVILPVSVWHAICSNRLCFNIQYPWSLICLVFESFFQKM